MNEEKGKFEYHYGFYAAVQFEYERVRSSFTFLQEHQLGKEPVQMDMLIIKRRPNTLNVTRIRERCLQLLNGRDFAWKNLMREFTV